MICTPTMNPAPVCLPVVGLGYATKTSPTMNNYYGCYPCCSSNIADWTMKDWLALPHSIKCAAVTPESLQPKVSKNYGHVHDHPDDDVAYHWTSIVPESCNSNAGCVDTSGLQLYLHLEDQPNAEE